MPSFARFRLFFGVALLFGLSAAGVAQQVWALRGTVVTPSGPVEDATLLIKGPTIVSVGRNIEVPAGTRVVKTGGVIYPGLIDLHNHVTWNALGRWSAGSKSGARYDWQQLPEYQMALVVPHVKMVDEGHGCAAERYAEVKAIAGGATSQAGLSPKDLTMPGLSTASAAIPAGCLGGFVRELGVDSRLYPKGMLEPFRYEVFPLGIDSEAAQGIINGLHDGKVRAALFHIAEGGAENASARREFGMLKARGLLVPGVSIIHGVALSPANFAEMAKASVGLVWSPHSNFELYGSTADVAGARAAGVKMAIAPDWSPTGSDGMLEELKYAAVWNATQAPPPFNDQDLFEMATVKAAELAGVAVETGSIVAGKRADLLILSAPEDPPAAMDVYASLVHSSVRQVALVVVDGQAIYGDPALMKEMRSGQATARLDVCGSPRELAVASAEVWSATVRELTTALGRWRAGLSELADCH